MSVPAARSARALVRASILLATLASTGCIGSRVIYPVLATPEQRREFDAAGPEDLQGETLQVTSMRVAGPYRVVPGDLLSIELPPEVEIEAADKESSALSVTVKSRVKDTGTVLLPMVGEQSVSGKTTSEIEELLGGAFNDEKHLGKRPNVVVTVSEYKTVSVVVIGSVNKPGVAELRSDRLSVTGALMEAGGIKTERGAKEIKIVGTDESGQTVTRSLSVHLDDIPLEDVALKGGETIVVEPPPERAFSVIGLVKKSGVFPYPAPRRYNLMQALAAAGGVDEQAAPRFATVYRVRADGSVLGATFKIDGTSLEDASNVLIKDGDVIAVDHTQGSWLRSFFSQVFGFRASVNVSSATTPTL